MSARDLRAWLGMKASVSMTRDVIVVFPELPLDAAWRIMKNNGIRHLPVVRAGALIGMLSDRDVLTHCTVAKNGDIHVPHGTIVAEAMTSTPLETCEPSTTISDLARLMTTKKIDAVPVVRGLHLLGLVTSTDLMLLLLERDDPRTLPFAFRLLDDLRAYDA